MVDDLFRAISVFAFGTVIFAIVLLPFEVFNAPLFLIWPVFLVGLGAVPTFALAQMRQ